MRSLQIKFIYLLILVVFLSCQTFTQEQRKIETEKPVDMSLDYWVEGYQKLGTTVVEYPVTVTKTEVTDDSLDAEFTMDMHVIEAYTRGIKSICLIPKTNNRHSKPVDFLILTEVILISSEVNSEKQNYTCKLTVSGVTCWVQKGLTLKENFKSGEYHALVLYYNHKEKKEKKEIKTEAQKKKA